jgi:two-component system chemotaxis response regulator CheY
LDAAYNSSPFDLVFLDWNMPEMDGFSLLQKCRADVRFKNLPIVMVTAESERQYVLKALSAGATDYITKPFSNETLRQKIAVLNSRLFSK